MGRLPAGQKPEPRNERMTRYRLELEAEGGHRLLVDIAKPANDALNDIMQLDTPADDGKQVTKKVAVTRALLHYAKVVRRRSQG